jgi:hypothetical protein
MLAAGTMTGLGGATVHGLEPDLLVDVMRRHGRIGARPPEEPRPA